MIATLCEIIKDGKLLLKKASRGVSKGNWNGLGGRIENNETEIENVIREVKEESGLTIDNPKKHGVITFYQGGRDKVFAIVHLFSTDRFDGEIKPSDEGELRWFDINSIPYEEMWPDDVFWLPLVLEGKGFNAEFIYDDEMKKILEHEIVKLE